MSLANTQGGFLTLLKKRNFLLLWLAQLISMTIQNASNYALLVLIEEITGSTTLIGLAIVCFSLPAVLIGAPAGVLVDHRNKRRVLWYSNCLRAIATFGFVVSLIVNSHQLIPVYLITFLISGISQFFAPAEGSSIPMLVSDAELMPALSLFNITFMLSQVLGFLLFAPIVLSFLRPFTLLGINFTAVVTLYAAIGILYLVCAGLIVLIPASAFKKPARAPRENISSQSLGALNNLWNEMRQGWRFIRRKPELFLPVIQLSFAGILLLVIGELATPVVTKLFELPATSMAVVFAPAGVGLVLGSIFMPRITQRLGKSRAIFIGSISLAITMTLLPLLSLLTSILHQRGIDFKPVQFVIAPVIMFAAGVEIDFINIPAQTAIQEHTPEWIKGRVLALQLMLLNAFSIPIIFGIGGIADHFGIANVLYLLAVGVISFGLWCKYYERKPHRWNGYNATLNGTDHESILVIVEDSNAESLKK
ncbi:MAG TPA: MFS transporter [Ktedonobacteraceae bacterium]|nr:MFS transporter [Ktedonobacteraceae bacterium]